MAKRENFLVKGNKIGYEEKDGIEWFSMTDLAKHFGKGEPSEIIRSWLKKKDTLDYLETYESMFNEDFNLGHMPQIKDEFTKNGVSPSVKQYTEQTNAKFIRAKTGRYGGTFGNFDISIHFLMWISSVFQIWFIRDYREMKEKQLLNAKSTKLTGEEWESQKKIDNLMETLRLEQDRLDKLRKEKQKLKK